MTVVPADPAEREIKRQCTATIKRTGKRCRYSAIRGGTVCWKHGGKAPQVKRAAERRLELAKIEAELIRLGGTLDVDPGEALLVMVKEAAWNVAFLREKVQALDQGVGPGGIAGNIGSQAKTNEAERHVLVTMYDAERDRLVNYSASALKAGVEERRVRLLEADVEAFFKSVKASLAVVPPEHREAFLDELAKNLRCL